MLAPAVVEHPDVPRDGEAGDVFALASTAWVCLFGELPFGEPPANASASSAVMVLAERARAGEFIEPRVRGCPRALIEVLRGIGAVR